MKPYPVLRTIHLLCGVFAVPALVMYGVSAVQMAHPRWFSMKPSTSDSAFAMQPNYTDGRQLAHDVMAHRHLRGEVNSVNQVPDGFQIRITVPGTVHDVRYENVTGNVHLHSSVSGTMGMLNRLHHAAGMAHDYLPLNAWGLLCGLVSLAVLGLGATGIWMWWLRKQERRFGLVLIAANLAFALTLLVMIRAAGP